MGRRCTKPGAHACADAASHRDRWPWLRGVPYVAYVGDPPSPSALPLRHGAVMGAAAALRGLRPEEMFAKADRRHAAMWAAFRQGKGEAMEALPAAARAYAAAQDRLADRLDRDGLVDGANAAYRREYAALDLEGAARGLEEAAAGYTAAIDERLRGGLLRGGRLRLFRLAGPPRGRLCGQDRRPQAPRGPGPPLVLALPSRKVCQPPGRAPWSWHDHGRTAGRRPRSAGSPS